MSKVLTDLIGVLQALVTKDLREPNNIEAFLDITLIIVTIALAIILRSSDSESSTFSMFCMMFAFIMLSFAWCVYHSSVKRPNREQ